MSGPSLKNIAIPEFVCHVAYIADEMLPVLLNCVDVLTLINRATSFVSFSYLVKLYEAMLSCIIAIVGETTATCGILSGHPDHLVIASEPDTLC